MQLQKRKDTAAEMAVRRLLHARGLRYRVGWPVPMLRRRTIDIAFPGRQVAVFIDGCFWHGCPDHCVPPKHNGDWWARKLQTNIDRDAETTLLLEGAGWLVLRFWEHEAPEAVAEQVVCSITNRRADR